MLHIELMLISCRCDYIGVQLNDCFLLRKGALKARRLADGEYCIADSFPLCIFYIFVNLSPFMQDNGNRHFLPIPAENHSVSSKSMSIIVE